MKLELEIISDIMSQEGPGKRKLLTKNDKIKRIFDLEEVELEEYVDTKTGKHIAKYSVIYKGDLYYKINRPYEQLKSIILNKSTPVIGFIGKSKRYK